MPFDAKHIRSHVHKCQHTKTSDENQYRRKWSGTREITNLSGSLRSRICRGGRARKRPYIRTASKRTAPPRAYVQGAGGQERLRLRPWPRFYSLEVNKCNKFSYGDWGRRFSIDHRDPGLDRYSVQPPSDGRSAVEGSLLVDNKIDYIDYVRWTNIYNNDGRSVAYVQNGSAACADSFSVALAALTFARLQRRTDDDIPAKIQTGCQFPTVLDYRRNDERIGFTVTCAFLFFFFALNNFSTRNPVPVKIWRETYIIRCISDPTQRTGRFYVFQTVVAIIGNKRIRQMDKFTVNKRFIFSNLFLFCWN